MQLKSTYTYVCVFCGVNHRLECIFSPAQISFNQDRDFKRFCLWTWGLKPKVIGTEANGKIYVQPMRTMVSVLDFVIYAFIFAHTSTFLWLHDFSFSALKIGGFKKLGDFFCTFLIFKDQGFTWLAIGGEHPKRMMSVPRNDELAGRGFLHGTESWVDFVSDGQYIVGLNRWIWKWHSTISTISIRWVPLYPFSDH